jgi:hypothetical protein
MSLGVIRSGGLPRSTLFSVGFESAAAGAGPGSGAPQGLLSAAEDQGSNIGVLFFVAAGGRLAGTGFGLGRVGEERLKAELKLLLGMTVGDGNCGPDRGGDIGATRIGAGAGAGAGAVEAQPPKSSELKRSTGIFVAGLERETGAGAGGEATIGF